MDKVQIINFLIRFFTVLRDLITYTLIARILLSWFTVGRPNGGGRIGQFLVSVTEPVLRLVKKLPHRIGIIDLSPLIALVGIDILTRLIILGLYQLA